MSILIRALIIAAIVGVSAAIVVRNYRGITVKNCGLAPKSGSMFRNWFSWFSSKRHEMTRRNATEGELPWVVIVLFPEGYCTGSILNDKWIITSAHCFIDAGRPAKTKVFAGVYDLTKVTAKDGYDIKRWKGHPKYNPKDNMTACFDIGLIELKTPLPLNGSSTMSPICLPPYFYNHTGPTEIAQTAGFGPYDYMKPRFLHTGWVTFNASYLHINPYDPNHDPAHIILVWRTPPTTGWTSCLGDSGGPLFQYDREGRAVLIGIFNSGNAEQTVCYTQVEENQVELYRNLLVYNRVPVYIDWIVKVINPKTRIDDE